MIIIGWREKMTVFHFVMAVQMYTKNVDMNLSKINFSLLQLAKLHFNWTFTYKISTRHTQNRTRYIWKKTDVCACVFATIAIANFIMEI